MQTTKGDYISSKVYYFNISSVILYFEDTDVPFIAFVFRFWIYKIIARMDLKT